MKERVTKLNSKLKALKTKNVIFLIALLMGILVLSMSIVNNFRLSLNSNNALTALNENKVSINVTPVTKVDVVLTKGRSATELTNFEDDLKRKLQEIGVNPEKVKVQAVTSENVESQNSFKWNSDISSTIGNISITNSGANISMVGNSRNAGSNAIWIIPDRSSEQEFTFGYNINFGDSFNAAGMLLRVQEEGNILRGYMLSFNYRDWSSQANGSNGALWEFTYTKGAHTNISKTLVQGLNIAQSGTLTVKATDSSISITGGGLSGTQTIALPKLYGSGYGFFSDHYGHFCDNIGQFTLTGINLKTDSIKDFNEVLRFPEWRDNSVRTIVNVSDVQNEQFNSSASLSSIVSRLLNDDISYIGWGTDATKEQMEKTISINDNNGIYIDNTDYENAIQKTAEYIKSLIIEKQKQYIIAGEDVDVYVEPNNIMNNTKDENYIDGKWKVIHDYTYFENDEGQYEKSGMYTDGVITDFTKPGKYTIFYADQEVNNSEIYVHRMPQASFDMSISGNNVTLTSTSYDLDKQSDNNGIEEEEWQYKKTDDSDWTSGKLTNIDGTSTYIVKLRVKDFQNTWSKATTKYIVGQNESVKPVADFIIKRPSISIYETLEIVDKSYDPAGKALTNYEWKIIKDNNEIYVGDTIPTNYSEYGAGEYQAQLTVKNEDEVASDVFIRSFTVKADTKAPEIIVNPTTKRSINEPISIGVSFKDDESGFKSYKYVITDSSKLVKDDENVTWSEEIEKQEDELTIDEFAKNQYLHIIATDNDGNISEEKVFGTYYVQLAYEIQVQAIDNMTKTGLKGVQFKITAEQDDGTQIELGNYDSTTNKDGKIIIKQVPLLGVNRITIETQSAPEGYEKEDYKVATLDTTTYKIVVDETKTSNDLVSVLSDDEQTVTLKVAMKKKTFDLNIINKDKDNNNIKLNNSIFTLSYNGQEIAQGVTKNGEVTLQGEIVGINKTAEYVLNQSSVANGYKLMTSTTLKISFNEKGEISKIAQKWLSTNNDIIIDDTNIGNITVLNQMQSEPKKFNVIANVSNRENSRQKISGMKYKVIVEGENNLKYEIAEEESDSMGNINFKNLYGSGLVKLTFVNTATVGDYVLENIEKFITINIDNDGKITNTNASMQGVYNKVENDTVYVNLNNAKKQSINTIRIQVLNKDEKLVGYPGIEFEVRKLIDNSLIGKGATNAEGTMDIDGVMIDGNGDVAYKIIPLNAEENGLDIDISIVSISYNNDEKIENAEQISDNENVNVYYKTQNDDDAYRHIANIEILQETKEILGSKQLIINKVDEADGTLLAGAKYKINMITSETTPVVKTTDGQGKLYADIPDAALVSIEITEIEAPVDYKLDNTTKTLYLQKNNDGKFNIVNKTNIEDGQITTDEDGNIIFTDKNVSMSNAQINLKLEVTDESGKIALGGSEFKVTEAKTGYSQIVTTGKDGKINLPSAIIKSAGTYTFTVEQTRAIKPYAIPDKKYVFEVNFTMGGSFVSFNGKTDISGTEILLHNPIVKQIPTDNSVDITIPVKNTISNDITGLEYGIDLKKVDTKGNVLTGAFYDLEIRPFDTGVITIKDCEVTNNIEILKQVLSGETTTILLQQTKAELGYNVDSSLKVVSLYYDGKNISCLNNTTSGDLQVNIIDKVIDGKTQKIIEITIVTPDPTTVKDPTNNSGGNNPGGNNPGGNNPGTDNPGTDNPGTDNPGTDNPGTDNPGEDEPDPTFTMHLFNKAKGTWERTYDEYEWYYNYWAWNYGSWRRYNSVRFDLNAEQRLPFFFDQTSYGFSFNQGTITKIKTQLIENGNVKDEIYEENISKSNEQDVNKGTDIVKFYKDYANKEVLITLQELVPAHNFKKIKDEQVKVKFDQNGKIISGEMLPDSLDGEYIAVAGISGNGQTEDIKVIRYVLTNRRTEYQTYSIEQYNCIGKNEMYCGILNESLNNASRVNINLTDEDTGEGLEGGAFTVLLEEKQYSENEEEQPVYNSAEKYNVKTDKNGNIQVVTSKTYANRTLRAYITEATPPTIGYYKYLDNVQGTLIVEMDFDDDGNIKEVRYVDVPSNMEATDNANEINVKVRNCIYYNFAINVTKIDENGNQLAGVKFNNNSILITDNIAQTGYSVFNYSSGLTNEEGKTMLKVGLPTTSYNNYYGKTIEYNISENYVPANYKAEDGIKLRVLYDLKGNVSQVSTVSGSGDNIISVQGNTENTVDITVQNERIEAPTFMITNVDSEQQDVKLNGTSYKIVSWDVKEYESGTLNLKDEIETNQTDSNGFLQVQMPNAHALRTILYEIEEVDTAYSYIKNPKLKIKVSYDKDGNIIGTPQIIDNPSIGRNKVLTIVGQPNGNKLLQLQIINEMKPKFTINIDKVDKVLGRAMKDAIFKAISQEKQADGTYLDADEERISVETDSKGYTKIGFKNAHNGKTMKYTIYEQKAEYLERGTLEVTFDIYGNIVSGTVNGDYIYDRGIYAGTNYANIEIRGEIFRVNVNINADNAQYSLDGIGFEVTTDMGDKNQAGVRTNSYGQSVEVIGEVYKNKTVVYNFHQNSEARDYNPIDDFSFAVTFDEQGEIVNCTPTSEDGKFNVLATQKDRKGINMSIAINQYATDRQKMKLEVYDDKDTTKLISDVKYKVKAENVIDTSYDTKDELDIGPDKNFAGNSITYTLTQEQTAITHVTNANSIEVVVDYGNDGTIQQMRINKSDGYVEIDESCYGSKTIKLKTQNRRKIITEIENVNMYKTDEKIGGHMFNIASQKVSPNYSDMTITDQDGKGYIMPGPYYVDQTVEYKLEQINNLSEFNKIEPIIFKIKYDENGKATDYEIDDKDKSVLQISIPESNEDLDFKLTVNSEPQVTVGIQTVDSKNNNKILGGKYIIEESKNKGEVTTYIDKISHASFGKIDSVKTVTYSIKEKQAPLGYKYINRDAIIGKIEVSFDVKGQIIPGSINVIEGYDYIRILNPTDKVSLYDIDLEIKYEESEEFNIIIENEDITDNTKKIVSTFNASISNGMTASTTTEEDTGYGQLQFGMIGRDTKQNIIINQSNVQGNYATVNTIGMNIEFDGSNKIKNVTPATGRNNAICGEAYTIDQISDYSIKITVKNNPITKLHIQNIEDGNSQKGLNGKFELTGIGLTSAVKIEMDNTGVGETDFGNAPKSQVVHYTIKQVDVDKSYRLIKPVDLVIEYNADGKIISASLNHTINTADDSAVKIISYDAYNVNLQILNKQAFSIYANTIDAYNRTGLSGILLDIKEDTYSNDQTTLTTDSEGKAITELGMNKPNSSLNYHIKVQNLPTGYMQVMGNSRFEADVRVSFDSTGKVVSAFCSNQDLIEVSIENDLAVTINVKFIPIAKLTVIRKDQASKKALYGNEVTINSTQMSKDQKCYTDGNGMFTCEVGGIKANNTIRYNISEKNKDIDNYADLSGLYLDVEYDDLGLIKKITPSNPNIMSASGEGTREIKVEILSAKIFKVSFTNVDFLENTVKIGGTYKVTSSKNEESSVFTINNNSGTIVTLGLMYPGEEVTYTIHQEGDSQYGYEKIPDISFVVKYSENGEITDIRRTDDVKDDRILTGTFRQQATKTQAHADIEFGSKAKLLVELQLVDWIYDEPVSNIGFKIKDEESGIETTVDNLSDENGVLKFAIDSVYADKTVNYTITQTSTYGGYKVNSPIHLSVKYDSIGTVNIANTHLEDLDSGELIRNYTKDLYQSSKLKGIQLKINMYNKIGLGIEEKDAITEQTKEGINYVIQEHEIETGNTKNYNMKTNQYGEAVNFDREVNTDVRTIEYTISQVQAPYGYKALKDFKVIVYYNPEGRVIGCDASDAPEQVNVELASSKLLTMTQSKEKVQIKITVNDDDRIRFKIVNKDANFDNAKIEGAKFKIKVERGNDVILNNYEITTDADGIATIDGIEGPGNIKISFIQTTVGKGYNANDKNDGFITINKAKETYTLTYVDSTDGIDYDVDSQYGDVTVYLTNENNLLLNIIDVNAIDKSTALNSEISLKAQVGEKTETVNDIMQNTNNEIIFEGTYINQTGTLQLNLGNTVKMAGKKVVFTVHEENPATDYETYGNVTFTIEFDENGRIDKIYPNEQRVLAAKKVDGYEANIVIGHGELQGKYSIKLIDESSVNNNRINGTQYHMDLSVNNNIESSYDMTTGTVTMGGVVIEEGVATIPELEYEGKIDIALNIKEETKGYLGLKKDEIVQISFESQYDDSTKMPILTNVTSNNARVLVSIDDIAKEIIVEIINDPVLDLKITNQDENENLLIGAIWNINVTAPGNANGTRTYGPYMTGDIGELFTQLVRDYANETIDITLTQDKIYGMTKLEPIILTATIDKDGKIEKLVTTQGQDNIVVDYGEYNIDIIVTNTVDKNAQKIEINLDKVSSSNEEIKLKNAMFQIRITPEQGCAVYKIKQTNAEGKLNIGNIVAAGNIKIEIIEIMPPEGYKLGLNNGIYTFKIYKDVLTGNIKKVESSEQNCEFNIDSENGSINLGIVNESEAATISVEKLDSISGLKLEGAQFKLIDTNSGKESISTTNKKGIANFPVDYQASKTVIYKVIEMSAPQGYKTNSEEMTITVEYDNKGRVVNVITGGNNIEEDKAKRNEKYIHTKVYNEMESINANIKPYEVEIIKTDDEDSNIALQGAEFDVNITQEVGINMNMSLTTDSDGKINIEKIRGLGKINISLNETKAPAGYVRDVREKTIELQRDTETGEISISNSNDLDVAYDEDNNKIIVKMSNKKESGKYALVINKTDINQNKIESNQTEIEVKIGDNNPVTYKTNDKGSIYLTNLQIPNDKTFNIYLTEKVAPDGYDINTKTQVITVDTDEIYGKRQITNVKAENGQDIIIKKSTSSIIELDMLNDIYHGLYLKSNKYIIGEKPDGYYEGQETEYKDGDTHIGTVASNTKLKDFINNISTNGEVSVRKPDGSLLQDDEIVKNGMTLIVVKGNEKIELIIDAVEETEEVIDVPYSLIINKTDMNENNILSNETQFEIKIGNDNINTYQTDENGKVTIENIKLPSEDTCDITIKEIVAPTGYELIQNNLKLKLYFEKEQNGNRQLVRATTEDNDNLKIKAITTEDNSTVTVNILNKQEEQPVEDDLYLKSKAYIIGNSKPEGYTQGDETEYKEGIEYIYKVDPRTTLTDFINNLDTNGTPVVTKQDGTVLGPDEFIGTDMKLTVTKGDKKIELIIAVKGDVSGDGIVTLQDYVTTRDAMVGEITLTRPHMLALDFSDDDEITLQDYVTERDYMIEELDMST